MLINCQVLRGEKMEHLKEAHIVIEGSGICSVDEGFVQEGEDMKGLLAVPGLINAHTHIGDSFAKDACAGLSVSEAVGRNGKKWSLYAEADRRETVHAMRDTAGMMLRSGISAYADYREGGHEGLRDLKAATKDHAIRTIALGRDLEGRFEDCDGLGLNLYQLDQIPEDRKGLEEKIVSVHAGEIPGEVAAALRVHPDNIVHYTHCTDEDIRAAAKEGISVVVCPRSNASLRVGFPPVRELIDAGVNVALGTDNVMINSPDMWREMEFLYRSSQLFEGLTPLEVLKSATVNGGRALKRDYGTIEKGMIADVIFVDLSAPNMRSTRNIHASLVCRCTGENVAVVFIGGKRALDKRTGHIY